MGHEQPSRITGGSSASVREKQLCLLRPRRFRLQLLPNALYDSARVLLRVLLVISPNPGPTFMSPLRGFDRSLDGSAE
jgi:hypothetical protein